MSELKKLTRFTLKSFFIKCANCGLDVVAKRKTRKFCSQKCAYAKRYIPVPRKVFVASCSTCSAKFLKKRWFLGKFNKFYCSRKCQFLGMRQNQMSKCCFCGKDFYVSVSQKKLRNRSSCSRACASSIRSLKAKKLIESGIVPKKLADRRIRYSKEMGVWRKLVFERDNYTCQFCFKRGGYLEADHIKPFSQYPELRFDLNNGRTLCRDCHMKTDTWGNRKKRAA